MQENSGLQNKIAELEALASEKANELDKLRQEANASKESLQSEITAMQRKLREMDQAASRASSEHAAQKTKLDAKIQNQRQVVMQHA